MLWVQVLFHLHGEEDLMMLNMGQIMMTQLVHAMCEDSIVEEEVAGSGMFHQIMASEGAAGHLVEVMLEGVYNPLKWSMSTEMTQIYRLEKVIGSARTRRTFSPISDISNIVKV